ncbi:MAG: PIN domain-containing protein [Chloroflexi bacterium]|nr:PIN domain-containing protein [Chloroflexota bacterium]MCY3939187.1 PIN domain-containing protein [Chloroflexota bacterium]
MSVAYVDTSALAAIAFGDVRGPDLARRLEGFSRLLASNLLEAELRAVFARERLAFETSLVAGVDWILPDRPLASEMATVLGAGYLRGADLWHVASALYAAGDPGLISFVTLDGQQGDVAGRLGFQT